ncbi:MAG: cyclase family protein [Nitrososphaerota archaeon]
MSRKYKIIDLSHELFPDMPSYPGLPLFKIEKIRDSIKNGSTINLITSMHTHLGTHIDFPLHILPNSKSLDDYSIVDLSGDGIVIDLTYKNEAEEILDEDLKKYDDHINKKDILFIFTGWSKKRSNNPEYLFKWPYIGESAVNYLIKKKIKIIGIDTLSIGGYSKKVSDKWPLPKVPSRKIHEMLLNEGILIVEEVANLDKVLIEEKFVRGFFIIAPLRIKGIEASPCKVIFISLNF